MKFKYFMLSLIVILGTFILDIQYSHAAVNIEPGTSLYCSNGQANPIYSDPELKYNTGRTLDPNIREWMSFNYGFNDDGKNISLDLGGGQWVSAPRYDPINLEVRENGIFKEYFSSGKSVSVYSDPYLMNKIGELATSINDWKITRISIPDQSDGFFSYDLGNNQWVRYNSGTMPIYNKYYFQTGTTLYNREGIPTSEISNEAHYQYKIFSVKAVDNKVLVKLGDDNQWADYNSGAPY